MSSPRSLTQLFATLLELQQETMDAGNAEASYHILSAALHCAEAANDVAGVETVIQLAGQRQTEIDARRPRHILSTEEAGKRGTTPLFASLTITSQAVRTRLHAEEVRLEHGGRRGNRGQGA